MSWQRCTPQTELSRQEQSMAESRREREKVLAEYRKQAEEKKDFAERVEKRVSPCSSHSFPHDVMCHVRGSYIILSLAAAPHVHPP